MSTQIRPSAVKWTLYVKGMTGEKHIIINKVCLAVNIKHLFIYAML